MIEDLQRALDTLHVGGIILYPTDTVWGIGCDATNSNAVEKVYKIKQRTDTKSMLVLVEDFFRLKNYVEQIPENINELLRRETKPLTIIYPGAKNLALNLIAEDGSIGIRIVKDEFCFHLIRSFKKPIVSTSANFSGNPAPGNFSEINPEIIKSVDYVVRYRQKDSSEGKPSRIIKVGTKGEIEVIRE